MDWAFYAAENDYLGTTILVQERIQERTELLRTKSINGYLNDRRSRARLGGRFAYWAPAVRDIGPLLDKRFIFFEKSKGDCSGLEGLNKLEGDIQTSRGKGDDDKVGQRSNGVQPAETGNRADSVVYDKGDIQGSTGSRYRDSSGSHTGVDIGYVDALSSMEITGYYE
jgi:hypothetical protein